MKQETLIEQLKKSFQGTTARGWIHGPRSFSWFLWKGNTLTIKEPPDFAALDEIRAFDGSKELRWFGGEFLEVSPDPNGLTQKAILFGKVTKADGDWCELDELRIGRHWVPVSGEPGDKVRLIFKETLTPTPHGTRVTDEVLIGIDAFNSAVPEEELSTDRK